LAERVVMLIWRLQRASRIETGVLVQGYFEALAAQARGEARELERDVLAELAEEQKTITDRKRHADALRRAEEAEQSFRRRKDAAIGQAFAGTLGGDALAKLARYEAGLERSLMRTLAAYAGLRGVSRECVPATADETLLPEVVIGAEIR